MTITPIPGSLTAPSEATIDRSLHSLIAEGSPDLHTITTIDGVYRFVSGASLARFGWESDELIGSNQDAFLHPGHGSPTPTSC